MCSSCNATYYGKTEHHLNVRSGEHIGLSPLTGNRVACKPSVISDHLLLHGHIIVALRISQFYVVKIMHLSYP